MGKVFKFIISLVISVLIFLVASVIVAAIGLVGVLALVIPAFLAFITFIIVQCFFKLFRLRTIIIIAAAIWLITTLTGVGLFDLFS